MRDLSVKNFPPWVHMLVFISPKKKEDHAQLYTVPFSPWPFLLSRSQKAVRYHLQLSAGSPRYGGSWWSSSLVASQSNMYPSCPGFCQASSGVRTNSLTNIMQSPGAGKMAGADRFLATQESGRKAYVRAVKHYTSQRGDPGHTSPEVAFSWGCDYPQGTR